MCCILAWIITPNKKCCLSLKFLCMHKLLEKINLGLLLQKQILLLLIINSSLIKLPTCTNQLRCYMPLLTKKMSGNFYNMLTRGLKKKHLITFAEKMFSLVVYVQMLSSPLLGVRTCKTDRHISGVGPP